VVKKGLRVLTGMPKAYYHMLVETIMIKVQSGTKARLRRLNPNLSELLREQIDRLLSHPTKGSAYDQAADLCGVIKGGPRDVSTSKEYLKQYGQKLTA
jgi:hypothetical protein